MISVIVCTHNPREDYLGRVLAALKSQLLPTSKWELLLIDNASAQPVDRSWDISWHSNARHVREEKLGLSHARLRGIRESRGELLIFVDDDNVLSNDYLSVAIEISQMYPSIGAFGASVKGEFEESPAAWVEGYLWALAIRELTRDYWSNLQVWSDAQPVGAGLCIRRVVAEDYDRKACANPLRTALDRVGAGMGTFGDADLSWCATDLGMGIGRFQALHLTHLIPPRRLTKDYLIKLLAGAAASEEILNSLRPQQHQSPDTFRPLQFAWRMLRASGLDRRIMLASLRQRKKARQFLSGQRSALQV